VPISNEEFEDSGGDAATDALSFLQKNRDRGAYNLTEIAQGIEFKGVIGDAPVSLHEIFKNTRRPGPTGATDGRSGTDPSLKNILNALVSKKLVEIKNVGGKDYYRAV
jgi:hypothetical protein